MTRPTLRGIPAPPVRGIARLWAWIPASLPIRIFLLVTLLESGVDIAIETVLLLRFKHQEGSIVGVNKDGDQPALPVFVMVFCLAHVYQCALAVDAVVNRNSILIFGLVIFNLAFLVYAIIQISEIRLVLGTGVAEGSSQRVPVQVLTTAIPCVIAVSSLIFGALSWWIYKDFGWDIYRSIVGADRDLKRAHGNYQIFVALLKTDFFVFIAFCLQLVLVVLQNHNAEYWLTVIAAPFSLLLLSAAWYSVRRELKYGMMAFMSALVGAGAYFSYKLYRIWQGRKDEYLEIYKSLSVFSLLAIALVLATLFFSIRCVRNFDRGLKGAIDRAALERKKSTSSGLSGPHGTAAPAYNGKGGMLPLGSSSTLGLNQNRLSLD